MSHPYTNHMKTEEFYKSNSVYLIKGMIITITTITTTITCTNSNAVLVYRFIVSLWKNADHGATCRASLYLLDNKQFWDKGNTNTTNTILLMLMLILILLLILLVTYPLMQRIDAKPDMEAVDINDCISFRNILLTHAASLEIITYERLGSIFLMDKVILPLLTLLLAKN